MWEHAQKNERKTGRFVKRTVNLKTEAFLCTIGQNCGILAKLTKWGTVAKLRSSDMFRQLTGVSAAVLADSRKPICRGTAESLKQRKVISNL